MEMKRPDTLFEVCFEACNKVGGIYTVVASKALRMKENFDDYVVIGPYYGEGQKEEFEERETPERFIEIFKELEEEGITCRYGTWKIEGEPGTILIDAGKYAHAQDGLKKRYWEKFGIDSLDSGWDFIEPMLWSTAAGKFIERFQEKNKDKKIVGHFHEWISSFGILLLNMAGSPVKTVFTTHATMLGRSISGSGKKLYEMLDSMDPEQEAKNHGVMNKFSTERACAHAADVFTTVSEITGMEAEKILGRRPEPLLFNGLDLREFPDERRLLEKRKESREKLCDLAESAIGERFREDIDKTRIIFTSGRYEFRNKGVDLFIHTLGRMEEDMKKSDTDRKVLVFFMIPNGWTEMNGQLKKNIEEHRRDREAFLASGADRIICSHDLENPDDDIMNALEKAGLTSDDSRIRCMVIPTYLSEEDGLLEEEYYDITSGCDVGVFASYYEPWGYTPPESLAVGVPTVTSDLAGFGRYIKSIGKETENMKVIGRFDNDDKASDELKSFLWDIVNRDIDENSRMTSCREIVKNIEWKDFIDRYLQAYDKALKNQKISYQ
ncbi:MAG: glycogen/starch synthase [Candidatus Woesearchaeota archaeon]